MGLPLISRWGMPLAGWQRLLGAPRAQDHYTVHNEYKIRVRDRIAVQPAENASTGHGDAEARLVAESRRDLPR